MPYFAHTKKNVCVYDHYIMHIHTQTYANIKWSPISMTVCRIAVRYYFWPIDITDFVSNLIKPSSRTEFDNNMKREKKEWPLCACAHSGNNNESAPSFIAYIRRCWIAALFCIRTRYCKPNLDHWFDSHEEWHFFMYTHIYTNSYVSFLYFNVFFVSLSIFWLFCSISANVSQRWFVLLQLHIGREEKKRRIWCFSIYIKFFKCEI